VKVHSLTLSFTPMLPLLARNLASPYLGHEPKVKVTSNEFLGKWPIFQPPHKKLNGEWRLNFQNNCTNPKKSIELNDNFIILKIKVQYEDLNATDKIYAHNIDETWLHSNPLSHF